MASRTFTTCSEAVRSARLRDDRVDALVLAHLGVAESIARRHRGSAADWSDLRQVAYVGLVKAAQRFDPLRGDEFISYAVPTISGEVKRFLRDCGWVVRPPRPVQELRAQLSTEIPRLTQALGREPSTRDLSAALGHDLALIEEALDAHNSMRPLSLDVMAGADGTETEPYGHSLASTEPGLDRTELVASLAAACRTLDARERRIVYLRFFEEKTQREIGRELGVTQMQISRLLRSILGALRGQLDEHAVPGREPAVREQVGPAERVSPAA